MTTIKQIVEEWKQVHFTWLMSIDDKRDVDKVVSTFLRTNLENFINEKVKQIEAQKACIDFQSDGFTHSCVSECDGVVENCRKCFRDKCSNKNCPLGKGVPDNNKIYNRAITDAIAILQASLDNK